MLFSSPIFSQASGSIAGLTFAHSSSGMTVRARSTPTNPDTARQRTVKHALARLSPYWGELLTQAERDAWNLYAANVVMTNVLGDAFHLTGQNHFLRANIPRIQSGISVLEIAPSVYDLGTFTAPTIFSLTMVAQRVFIGFENTDDWANSANGHMIFYVGRPLGQGRGYYGGPYRFGNVLDGNPVPPSSPFLFTSPYAHQIDQIVWVRIRIIQVDGRLSLPIVLGPFTVTL